MVAPLNNQVLVKINEESKTKAGIILVADGDKRTECGVIIAIDKSVKTVKKGETIYFKTYSLSPIKINDEELNFIKEEDILAVER